jgi:hypothetical protein
MGDVATFVTFRKSDLNGEQTREVRTIEDGLLDPTAEPLFGTSAVMGEYRASRRWSRISSCRRTAGYVGAGSESRRTRVAAGCRGYAVASIALIQASSPGRPGRAPASASSVEPKLPKATPDPAAKSRSITDFGLIASVGCSGSRLLGMAGQDRA